MLTFEIATEDDEATVSRVLAAAYGTRMGSAYAEAELRDIVPIIAKAQDKLLRSGTFFIAWDDQGAAVAVGGWTREAPGNGPVTPGLAHVRHVAADPAHKGHGHGRALVEHLMDEARAADNTEIEALSTLNAEPFYASLGFRRIEEIDAPLNDGIVIPSVRMRAPLHT